MRRWWIGVCLLGWLPPASALTSTQLDQAIEHLRVVIVDANTMRDRLQNAEANQQGTLSLTAVQRQQLRDEYAAAKAQIQTLMGQLP